MELRLNIEDDVIRRARLRAEAMGTTVNQLVSEYIQQFSENVASAAADEFEALSTPPRGDRRGWEFDRGAIQRDLSQ